MGKYKGQPIVYDYWVDLDEFRVYAIVAWTDEPEDDKHSNLILISTEYYGY